MAMELVEQRNATENQHRPTPSDILFAKMDGITPEVVFKLVQSAGIAAIGRFKCTCKSANELFTDCTFAQFLTLNWRGTFGLHCIQFKPYVDFGKTCWPHLVQAESKRSTSSSQLWKTAIRRKTERVSLKTLTASGWVVGINDRNLTRGKKDWRLIFLALCAGCNFDQQFGEMTFAQWLMITNPYFFEFLFRFVIGFDGCMINFGLFELPLKTKFSIIGTHDVSIIHTMSFVTTLSKQCLDQIVLILHQEIREHVDASTEDNEINDVNEKMLNLLLTPYYSDWNSFPLLFACNEWQLSRFGRLYQSC